MLLLLREKMIDWQGALQFFLVDTVKILVMLFVLIAIIGFARTYIPAKKVKKVLKKGGFFSYLSASLFGSVTPFCSCSSIPLFIGFIRAGAPLGPSLAFLATSPLVNEYVAALMLVLFGWKVTVAYVISGILLGMITGFLLRKKKWEAMLVKEGKEAKDMSFKTVKERCLFGLHEAIDITKKLWLWVVIGVAIGAVIHNLVPEAAIIAITQKTGFFAPILAVILGVPLYGSSAALIPVAEALFTKGLPLGTTLALVMATAALSFPEAVMLRRVMKLRLLAAFFGIVALAIIIIGYVFNGLSFLL